MRQTQAGMSAAVISAVERIVEDISDRSGLGDEWGCIDEDVQNEIKNEWAIIIQQELGL